MSLSPRHLLLCLWVAAVCFSPIAVGAFPAFPYALGAGALLVFAAYAFGLARSPHPKQVALALLSICFAVTLFDLSARPLFVYLLEVRPTERFIHPWPPLPRLLRYDAGVTFDGVTYGDLAALSGRTDWREERRVKFVTDAYGFRNEPTGGSEVGRPPDVIVLGDSFGVAGGTSQEETLSALFARDYNLSVYNLSISKENPLQEYANLLLEGRRLRTRAGTYVLWLIFTGNDLDEPYYPELEDPRPAPTGLLARLATGFNDFKARSPVRRLLSQSDGAGMVIDRSFVDGRRMLFFKPYAERRGRTTEEIKRHPNFESLKATLGAMARLAAERRLTIAVALVPSKEEIYSWTLDGTPAWSTGKESSGFAVVMRELCAQHGFRFLDLKQPLVVASRRVFEETGALLWWRDDTHWNAAGQRTTAEAIQESLLSGGDTLTSSSQP